MFEPVKPDDPNNTQASDPELLVFGLKVSQLTLFFFDSLFQLYLKRFGDEGGLDNFVCGLEGLDSERTF